MTSTPGNAGTAGNADFGDAGIPADFVRIAGAPESGGAADPFLAGRLDTIGISGVSPLRPPAEFLAAVARRRDARQRTRLLAGLAVAAALVLAGVAYRVVLPAPGGAPLGEGPLLAADSPSVQARLRALREPAESPELPGASRGGARAAELRAGFAAAMLRGDGRLPLR